MTVRKLQANESNRRQNVLLALCGLSPAIITETVWALTRETPPTRIGKVVALTTVKGRTAIESELFTDGVWQRLRITLSASDHEMVFAPSGDLLRVIPENNGCEMTDIATSDDSMAAADFLLETLRQFTENPDTRIVFSIAGGRKTMSALAALCMTLLGRPQDRLCHVLVNPPYDTIELQPKFYFPEAGLVHSYRDSKMPSSQARICLHDIPYVRCREVFRREYARLPGKFLDTVKMANRNLAPLSIKINPRQGQCLINQESLSLSTAEFTFYWLLCERRWEEMPPLDNALEAFSRLVEFTRREDIRPYLPDPNPDPASQTTFDRILAGSENLVLTIDENELAAFIRHLADRIKRKLKKLPELPNPEPLFPSRGRARGYGLSIPSEGISVPGE